MPIVSSQTTVFNVKTGVLQARDASVNSDHGAVGQQHYFLTGMFMDSIGIEATTASSGDVHGLSIPAVIGMLILVLILGLISSRRLRVKGLGVHHLFLRIALKRANEQLVGFVRSLDLHEMNLVMGVAPRRGEDLLFDLSSLPGFPAEGKTITGKVNRVKNLGENNHNFLVSVSLEIPSKTTEVALRLADYLRQLHA